MGIQYRKRPPQLEDKVWIDKGGKQHEFKCMNCSYLLAIFNFLKKHGEIIPRALDTRLEGCMKSVANLFDDLDLEESGL